MAARPKRAGASASQRRHAGDTLAYLSSPVTRVALQPAAAQQRESSQQAAGGQIWLKNEKRKKKKKPTKNRQSGADGQQVVDRQARTTMALERKSNALNKELIAVG